MASHIAVEETTPSDMQQAPPQYSEWRRFLRVLAGRKITLVGAIILVILIIIALFAPILAPYDPYEQNLAQVLEQPSSEHWLGTDEVGRDTLSRIIYGSRVSLEVGIIAIGFATVFGIVLGLLAGFIGGWVDIVIMRVADGLMAFPFIVLALALAVLLGGGLRNVIIAIGIAMTPGFTRIMRGLTFSIKENNYVMAARSIGVSNIRIMLFHILPNALPVLLVSVTVCVGAAILFEASLSFLGVGIAPPGAAWGAMVSKGYPYLLTNPLLSLTPGLCIMLMVMAFNLAGDALRDALDPRLRGII